MGFDLLLSLKDFSGNHFVFRRIILLFWLFFCIIGIGESKNLFTLPEELLNSAASQYGNHAKRRLLAWQALILDDSGTSEVEELVVVNDFFNRMKFVNDIAPSAGDLSTIPRTSANPGAVTKRSRKNIQNA